MTGARILLGLLIAALFAFQVAVFPVAVVYTRYLPWRFRRNLEEWRR